MEYLDEKIAKIQNEIKSAEKRKNLKEKLKEENLIAPEKELDLEEAVRSILNGEIKIKNMKIFFEEREFYDEKLKWMFPKDFYELIGNKNRVFTFANRLYGAHLIIAYKSETNNIILNEVKEKIKSKMSGSEYRTIWVEEGTEKIKDKAIDYFIFKNPQAGGDTFNIMIYIPMGKDHILSNFDGQAKNIHEWILIAKAMIRTINI